MSLYTILYYPIKNFIQEYDKQIDELIVDTKIPKELEKYVYYKDEEYFDIDKIEKHFGGEFVSSGMWINEHEFYEYAFDIEINGELKTFKLTKEEFYKFIYTKKQPHIMAIEKYFASFGYFGENFNKAVTSKNGKVTEVFGIKADCDVCYLSEIFEHYILYNPDEMDKYSYVFNEGKPRQRWYNIKQKFLELKELYKDCFLYISV